VGTTLIGKLVLYLTLTHVAASFGVTSLAAHQVMLSLFYSLTPFCDTIGNTAQTFLPSIKSTGARGQAALMRRLTKLGLSAGVVVSTIAGTLALARPQTFTLEPAVMTVMAQLAPLAMLALVGHGALLAAEGWMLSSEDPNDRHFLGNTYAVMMVLVPAVMTAVKYKGGGIVALWKVFALFQLSRLIIMRSRFALRIRALLNKQKREELNIHQDENRREILTAKKDLGSGALALA